MHKNYYFRLFLAVLFSSIAANTFAQFSRQQAINKVLNEIVVADTGKINVYSIIPLKNYQDTIELPDSTLLLCPYYYNWVFFVDDHPNAGWAHSCRYIFMDTVSGNYQINNEEFYPVAFGTPDSVDFDLVKHIYYYPEVSLPPNQNNQTRAVTTNEYLYAVIIVTEDAVMNPHQEYHNFFWNDASAIFSTLVNVYGYSKDHIYVHYYDGTSPKSGGDLDDDGINDIDYPASVSRILETFDNLAGTSNSDEDIHPLTASDQLFVFIDGHGIDLGNHSTLACKYPGPYYQYLYDNELAYHIENMNCAQMIFLIQPCFSGNFASELTTYNSNENCKNRVVHTSTSIDYYSTTEVYMTNNRYMEYTFYWTAAARGNYPVFDAPWVPSYETGSFPFDVYYPFAHPDDYDPDLNGDDFVQMEEAFLYADDMDAWSPEGYHHYDNYCWECYEEPVREDKIGYPDDEDYNNLITLYGLAGGVADYESLLTGRNYMAGNTITVDDDLTIEENSNLYLTGDDGKINVNDGGELEIGLNCNIYNNELNIDGLLTVESGVSFNDQEINVNGEVDIAQYVTFNNDVVNLLNESEQTTFDISTFNTSELNSHDVELNLTNSYFNSTVVSLLNEDMESTFDHVTFNSGHFVNYGAELNIINTSDFNNCTYNNSYAGDINVSTSDFYNCWLILENESSTLASTVNINNCIFTHDDYHTMAAIDIWNYNNFLVGNNEISGYYNGIQLSGSGQFATLNSSISNNNIHDCTRNGISIVGSNTNLTGNYFHDNDFFGIATVNNSNVAMVGDCNANSYDDINLLKDNDRYELYATNGSFPWIFRYNAIIDEDNQGNPDDPLILIDPVGGIVPKTHVEYNCWGNNFDPSEDLNPAGVFMYDPTWCPGDGCQKSSEVALQTLMDGKEYFENGDYSDAKETFEEVIELYPTTLYASAAMKELFALEKNADNDYNALKQYYETNDSIQANTLLAKLADYLINKCEIELQHWQTAIDHFEDIIENPESTADSIFAIIDLGYTYKLMGDTLSRSTAMGKMTEYIPTSTKSFIKKRDYLLSLLPADKTKQEQENMFEANKAGELLQNIPNPFTNTTTINYKLDGQYLVSIKVFDHIGRALKIFNEGVQNKGMNKAELNMNDLPSGIYFYSLYLNGQLTDTRKMVVQ